MHVRDPISLLGVSSSGTQSSFVFEDFTIPYLMLLKARMADKLLTTPRTAVLGGLWGRVGVAWCIGMLVSQVLDQVFLAHVSFGIDSITTTDRA